IAVDAAAIMRCSGSLVLPVRVFRMFQVPQRASAADDRGHREVVFGWWRSRGPFERPCIPGIIAGRVAGTERSQNVDYQYEHGDALHERSDRCDQVKRLQASTRLIGINAARHPAQTREMQGVEGQMEANQE